MSKYLSYPQSKRGKVGGLQLKFLDHNTCAAFAVLSTKFFFDRFKKKGENPKLKDVPAAMMTFVNILKKKEEKKYLASGRDEAYH